MKQFLKKQLPSFVLALLVMASLVPAASAVTKANIEESVDAGEKITFSRKTFKTLFDEGKSGSDTFSYLEFTDYDDLDDYGYFLALDYDGDEIKLTGSKLKNTYFYYDEDDVPKTYDYALTGLTFVANKNADEGTLSLDYVLCGSSKEVSGIMKIKIGGSSSANGDIQMKVDPDDEVDFSADDFNDFFQKTYKNYDFKYLVFTDSDNLSSSSGYVYYNYGRSSAKRFTASSLEKARFYYDAYDIDEEDEDYYPLDNLSFVSSSGFDDVVTLEFRAYYSSSRYVDGTVTIASTDYKDTSVKGDIQMEVDPDDEVDFDADDFNDFFQKTYKNYDFKYLVFTDSDNLSSSTGYVYYRYGRSSAKRFTASSLEKARFYYDADDIGEDDEDYYPLEDLSFVSSSGFDDVVTLEFRAYYSSSRYVDGTVTIASTDYKGSSVKGDVQMEVEPDGDVDFDADDFNDFFQKAYKNYDFKYLVFTDSDNLGSSTGYVYYRYGRSSEKRFTASGLKKAYFYRDEDDIDEDDEDCYPLEDLSFVADTDFDDVVTLEFRAYYSSSRYVDGTVTITSTESKNASVKGDITYPVSSSSQVVFTESDFEKFYESEQSSGTFRYIKFTNADSLKNPNGLIYTGRGSGSERILSWNNLGNYRFYASGEDPDDYEDGYALSSLSFLAGRNFTSAVALKFRAYSTSSRYAEGVLVFQPGTSSTTSSGGDILYSTIYTTNVQINPNDIARFFNKTYPSSTLQYVKLNGVPSTGALYYNYYNASQYGAKQTAMTSSNISATAFYFSPSSTSQYSLGELTFLPNNRTNYCDSIPFTAYGSGGQSVSGTILISVTLASVSEVYGVTPKNKAVDLPAPSIYSAVVGATGTSLASIRLLKLPSSSVGTVYVGSGTSVKANTSTQYGYSTGTQKISQLRFVPASNYTGSVEIPYVAYNSSGSAIAVGSFCLGIVNTMKKFSDITTSVWCYKYVSELSSAGIISGYSDGTFKPDNAVTYGAALKLVMLAAGYSEQAPTNSNVFSGYLAKAKADGLVSGTIDLSKSITRLQVAQLAAKAMKLDISNLSSVKPFTDTSDPYVQALNAAGIVGGYFSNGTSTFKPSGTLTRGQLSAIVWRMGQVDA